MSTPFIVDAHLHLGSPGVFFAPEMALKPLLARMDKLLVKFAVCTDHLSLTEGGMEDFTGSLQGFEESGGRICYLGVYDPRHATDCLDAMKKTVKRPGFVGLKIHPSFHQTPAEDPLYEPAWRFAADHDLPILSHSWSISDFNPSQKYSVPERFEPYIRRFSTVRFILAHAGGRGTGRYEMIRLVNQYSNVYTDFAGDIFCYRLIESLVHALPGDRILYGSDFPWLDPRANLARVYLADISTEQKRDILCNNAIRVYKLGTPSC